MQTENMRTQLAISAALFLMLISGCGVRPASAPRVDVAASESLAVRDFAPQDVDIDESQLFLWRREFTDTDVERVLRGSSAVDDVKETLRVRGQRRDEARAVIQRAFDDERGACIARTSDEAECPVHDLASLPAKESKKGELERLGQELAELRKGEPTPERDKQIDKLLKRIKRCEEAVASFDQAHAVLVQAGLPDAYGEWKALESALEEGRAELERQLRPIAETVWLYNTTPVRFSFRFGEDRALHVAIDNWDLANIDDPDAREEGVGKAFSTEARTIGNARYSRRGGVFSFEVYTPRAAYWFRLARNKYDAGDDRVHYKGDVVRCSVTDGFGRPRITHERDFVRCDVDASGLDVRPDEVGKPQLRRGAANLGGVIVQREAP